MSAEAPTPHPEMPRRRSRVVKSNLTQILLFSILTLILTAAVVWGGRTWLRNSETLVFAVGEANGPEARFAARLATVLKNNSSRLRLKIVPNGDNAKALSQFDRKEANLAILRTDARIPPRARALAILEHDLLLLISPDRQENQDHRRTEEKEDRGHRRQRERGCAGAQYPRTLRTPRRRQRGSRWPRRARPSTSCSPLDSAPWSRSRTLRKS